MPIITDIVQITADNTNVYDARLGDEMPPWAKRVRFQLVASDSDWTFDLTINGVEIARDSGPHRTAADNTQSGDWASPHCMMELDQRSRNGVQCDVNVVTGGVGLAILQYES